MIKALVFDFDGLIMDTETEEYRVLQEMFQTYKAELPLDVWGQCIGTRQEDFDVIGYLEQQIKQTVDREDFYTHWREKVAFRLEKQQALPGVEGYLQTAKDLGLKVGLATSSSTEWVSNHLRRIGLWDHFDCVRTADDVKRVKPDPELYLAAAECLGVKPEEAIAFEDSVNGSQAAKRAGMYCVIVPNEVTKAMTFGDVDHRMASLAEMELEALIDFLMKGTS